MMQEQKSRRTVLAAAAGVAGATLVGGQVVAQVAPPPAAAFDNPSVTGFERGVTKPLHEPKLAFVKPGVVAKVNVKEGDVVKAGQILATQDDREEQAEMKSLEGDIKGAQLQIEASEADLELKKVQLDRRLKMYGNQPNSEVDEARAAAKVAEISIKYRQQELISAKLKYEAAQVRASQKQLPSPINGIVAKVDVRVGEGSDISRAAFQVVANDTLYVESDVPATKAKTMKVGQPLAVRYLDEENWMQGKIVFLTPYANASSGTRRIRLEMKNDGNREAGLPVYVRLPDAAAPAAAAVR